MDVMTATADGGRGRGCNFCELHPSLSRRDIRRVAALLMAKPMLYIQWPQKALVHPFSLSVCLSFSTLTTLQS